MRLRHIAPVALVLALSVAGFIVARLVAERDVRRESDHRADVAAAQIRDRVAQGASLTQSLRRFMLDTSGTGVNSAQFARNALRWLTPAGLPAAAWVEQVPDSLRDAYERRLGEPLVTPDQSRKVVPRGSRSSYLPATLVSGFEPMAVPGMDLSAEPGMEKALARATRIDGVAATPVAPASTGTAGLFLVAPAPNLIGEALHPGYVVVFVSDSALRAAATDVAGVQIRAAGAPTSDRERPKAASKAFTAAAQRLEVLVPRGSVHGLSAALPWLILAAGLILSALVAAVRLNAARRAKAQDELDRVFNLSTDMITVANFDGYFTRVNPAAERILGYTEEELLARPYIEFVHPDDRDRTAGEADAIGGGKVTQSFENRYIRKDGSHRVLEWTSTPVEEDALMYGVARDVTERRQTEAEAKRLADEQAALRRVATRVAEGAPPTAVLDAVAGEMEALLDADQVALNRFEPGEEIVVLAQSGLGAAGTQVGSRVSTQGENLAATVRRTGRPARTDDYDEADGALAELARATGLRSSVAAPIVVEGRLWGLVTASWKGETPPPPGTEERMSQFAELLDAAIANADSRDQLTASRTRLLTEADEARRRVVRDLHDGAQQRLVHAIVTLKLAQQALGKTDGEAASLVNEALEMATRGNEELRELAHGILPGALTRGGLTPGVDLLVKRLDIPVAVDIPDQRFPAEIEASAYFIVAEALTNVVKHSHAGRAEVRVSVVDGMLRIEVRDDGTGGADPEGHGLVGIADRATALGGRLEIDSPAGGGTLVAATLPLSRLTPRAPADTSLDAPAPG